MPNAHQIVDKLIQEVIDPEEFMCGVNHAWVEEYIERTLTKADDIAIPFGFAISTGTDDVFQDNMREAGHDPDKANWNEISKSLLQLEVNIMEMLSNKGITLRDEGHSDDSRIGSAWLHTKFGPYTDAINKRGIDFARLMIADSEPLRSGSGTIMHLGDEKLLFKKVDPITASAADITVEFIDTDTLSLFFDGLSRYMSIQDLLSELELPVTEAKKYINVSDLEHPFLAGPGPSGIFRKDIEGVIIFSARCPGCNRIHGNFRTYEEAAGNRQCKFCTRDYVEKMTKVATTGNFKHLLKKDHQKKAEQKNHVVKT